VTVDNGRRGHLVIDGVFDGQAGIQGDSLAFRPNRRGASPKRLMGGILDGEPVLLTASKDEFGPFWSARFEVIK
jgi:hypothetical protein